jgi:predicted  nucleic acid-binding Zn-ribbon protein
LEDGVLEIMEQAEPVDAELAALDARRRSLAAEGDGAQAALTSATAAVGAELAGAEAERAGIADAVPPHQLTAYDEARAEFGTIAVARLVGTQCQGCHLTLSAVALQAARKLPPDAVVHCEECGRLLVR